MTINKVEKLRNIYMLRIVCIALVMTIAALLIKEIFDIENIEVPLLVSVGFSIIVNIAEIMIWSSIAKKAADYLPMFYTASSGFRMLLALIVMLVYYLLSDQNGMLLFFVIFMLFYFVFLINHVVFFARVSVKQMTT